MEIHSKDFLEKLGDFSAFNDETFETARKLISALIFSKNEDCTDDFVLDIPEDYRTQYEPDDAIGLGSSYLPTYTYVCEQDGEIFVGFEFDDEIELDDFDAKEWNVYTLIDCLVDAFGDWAVEIID